MDKTISSTLSGFTPAPDVLIQMYGYMTALVWGRIWRYCQMSDGVCRAKLETIAGELGMSDRTIMRHIDPLVADGYLIDKTPELKNKPHIYADTFKIRIRISIEATTTESHSAVTKSHSRVTQSHRQGDTESVEESIKKESKDLSLSPDDFAAMSVEQAHKVPELKLYAAATGFFPGSLSWHYVYSFIRENKLTKERIHAAAEQWELTGYQKTNVKGILEWARDGVPDAKPKRAQNGKKPVATEPKGFDAARKFLERQAQHNG